MKTIAGLSEADARLLRCLRDTDEADASGLSSPVDASLVEAAGRHGVTALLALRLAGRARDSLPPTLRESLLAQAGWEAAHRRYLGEALAALADVGVEPVIFKGTALAYSIYPNPVLRARGDTDLLVPESDRDRVARVLQACGFEPPQDHSVARVHHQSTYSRKDAGGTHDLDVHWRINDSAVLADLFTYEELRGAATSIPSLSPHALAAAPDHALLLACMHRGVHRNSPYYSNGEPMYGGNRLVWLYDMHLLCGSFEPAHWHRWIEGARAKGLLGACAESIDLARDCFGTRVPEDVGRALAQPTTGEPASGYLSAGPARQVWLDWRAVRGVRMKGRYLRELFVPSAEYMRAQHTDEAPRWLAWQYVRRAARGAWRRLRRPGA